MALGTGLYIDKRGMEIVQISKQFGSLKVVGAGYVPIATSVGGQGADQEVLVKSLQQLFRQAGVRPSGVVTALPSEEVMVRYFEMPTVPKKDWPTAVRFEGKKYIPFRLDEVVSSYYVQPSAPRANTMKVVFVVAKQQALGSYVGVLQTAGVRVTAVEAVPFGLWRLYQLLERSAKEWVAIVVYVGAELACVSVMHRQGLQLTRDIVLARATAPMETPVAGDRAGAASSWMSGESLSELLLSEIRLTMDYYRKRFPSDEIGRVALCGVEECEGLVEPLSKELGLPVRFWRLDRELGLAGRSVGALALATGFALRDLMPRTGWVNLAERKVAPRVPTARLQRLLILEVAFACLVLAIWYVFLRQERAQIRTQLAGVASQRPAVALSPQTPLTVAALTARWEQLDRRHRQWDGLVGGYLPMTHRLSDLGQALPEGVWVTGVTYEEKAGKDAERRSRSWALLGLAFLRNSQDEIRAINRFITNLRAQPELFRGFDRADLVTVQRRTVNQQDVTGFEIRLSGEAG